VTTLLLIDCTKSPREFQQYFGRTKVGARVREHREEPLEMPDIEQLRTTGATGWASLVPEPESA